MTSGWNITISSTNLSLGCQQLWEHVNIRIDRKCKYGNCVLFSAKRNVSENAGRSCNSQISLDPQRTQMVGLYGELEAFSLAGSGAPRSGGSSRVYLKEKNIDI